MVGVDINPSAIAQLARELPEGAFYARDVAAAGGVGGLGDGQFAAIVCQLVLSVVGDAADRAQLLANAAALLVPRPVGRLGKDRDGRRRARLYHLI